MDGIADGDDRRLGSSKFPLVDYSSSSDSESDCDTPGTKMGPFNEQGAEVCLGGLPRNVTEDEVKDLCECAGPVADVKMLVGRYKPHETHFAWVRFQTKETASKAIIVLNKLRVKKYKLSCKAVEQCSTLMNSPPSDLEVFIGGLPSTISPSTLEELCSTCGQVSKLEIMDGKHLSSAYVTYQSKEMASKATKVLNDLKGTSIICTLSERKTCLFIGQIDKSLLQEDLEKAVSTTVPGAVEISLKVNPYKMHNYAFIKFKNHECAEYAMVRLSRSDFMLKGRVPAIRWSHEDFGSSPMPSRNTHMRQKYPHANRSANYGAGNGVPGFTNIGNGPPNVGIDTSASNSGNVASEVGGISLTRSATHAIASDTLTSCSEHIGGISLTRPGRLAYGSGTLTSSSGNVARGNSLKRSAELASGSGTLTSSSGNIASEPKGNSLKRSAELASGSGTSGQPPQPRRKEHHPAQQAFLRKHSVSVVKKDESSDR